MTHVPVSELVGKTLTRCANISGEDKAFPYEREAILFVTTEGVRYIMWHPQD